MKLPDPAVTPAPSRARPGEGRITEIQGLRAVAIILVVINHAGLPLQGGFVGVNCFFVISGYVITRLLWHEMQANQRIRLARFYGARVRRLLPASALVITFCAVVSLFVQSPLLHQPIGINVIGSALWSANGTLLMTTGGYFDAGRELAPLLHMWSLAVEEQFYLAFPLLVALGALGTAGRVEQRRRCLLGLLSVVAVGSLALSIWTTYSGNLLLSSFAYYAPLTHAWEFILGAIAFLLAARLPAGWRQCLAAVGMAMILWAAVALGPDDAIPGYIIGVPAVGTALILASVTARPPTARPTVIGRVLSTRPMERIGDLSYSWYLWHWPLVVFASIGREHDVVRSTAMSIIALGLASLTYRHVEQPFRRARHIRVRRYLTVCLIPPLTMGMVLVAAPRVGWANTGLADSVKQLSALPANFWSCVSRVPFTERDPAPCTFNADAEGKPIVLIGDSTAVHLTDGLLEAAEELDRPLMVASASSCAFVDLPVEGIEEYCSATYRSAVEWLDTLPPSTVIIHHAVIPTQIEDVFHATHADTAAWQDALARTYAVVRDLGHEPMHVSPPPFLVHQGAPWDPRACTLSGFANHSDSCVARQSLADVDAGQQPILDATTAAARAAGVEVVDIRPVLCAGGVCESHSDGMWNFIDSTHMTVHSSERLARVFLDAVRSAEP